MPIRDITPGVIRALGFSPDGHSDTGDRYRGESKYPRLMAYPGLLGPSLDPTYGVVHVLLGRKQRGSLSANTASELEALLKEIQPCPS